MNKKTGILLSVLFISKAAMAMPCDDLFYNIGLNDGKIAAHEEKKGISVNETKRSKLTCLQMECVPNGELVYIDTMNQPTMCYAGTATNFTNMEACQEALDKANEKIAEENSGTHECSFANFKHVLRLLYIKGFSEEFQKEQMEMMEDIRSMVKKLEKSNL